jgi:hypothetical protein
MSMNSVLSNTTPHALGEFLKWQFTTDAVMNLLVNSHVASGPFDGGCLVVARAIIEFVGEGNIVRMVSNINHGQTEHYGALVRNRIYDADGMHVTWQMWTQHFAEVEHVHDRQLGYAEGIDPLSSIMDSDTLVAQLQALLRNNYVNS